MATEIREIYTQDYRHFDNLIWQVPAWATAVFSFSVTSAVIILANSSSIEKSLPIDPLRTLSVFLFSVFAVLVLLTNVFLKFRLHQKSVFRPHRRDVPSLWFMPSGQTSLLLILFVESSVILCFSLVVAGISLMLTKLLTVAFLLVGFSYVEWSVRRLSATIKADRESAKDAC